MQGIRTTQIQVAEGVIDLGVGQPALAILPQAMLQQAATHCLSQQDPTILQYGPEEGDGHFNVALAQFLCAEYGRGAATSTVHAEQLFVTNGISQALDLICTLFTKPGDLIFVEEPTYFLVFRIFQDHGLRIESIPVTAQGMDLAILEEKLQRQRPAFVYTIPTAQNPTSVTMPQAQRERLVVLSRAYDFLLVADEVYQLLQYSATPPRPFGDYVEEASILALGSFSKILAPGLRLGWIQTAPATVKRFVESGIVQSGGGLNPLITGIVRSALALGLQEAYLQQLRTLFTERITLMDAALRRDLPSWVHFNTPTGGYFYWLTLPQELDANQLLTKAATYQVGFRPGRQFSHVGALHHYMRLSFSYYERDELIEGVARLAALLHAAA